MSIIIPVYNGAALIGPCLEAALRQDLPRAAYEILVVDNGSTDDTGAVVRRYPVRLAAEAVRSAYAARNTGIRLARGEILAFTDADCRPDSHWLSAALAALARGADCVGGRIRPEIRDPANPWEWYSAKFFLAQETFVRQGWAATANLVTTRRAFERIGLFPVNASQGTADLSGDKEWGLRATAQGMLLRYSTDASVAHLTRKSFGAIVARLRVVHASTARIERRYGRRSFGEQAARRLRGSPWVFGRIVRAFACAQLALRPASALIASWPLLEALKLVSFSQGWIQESRRLRNAVNGLDRAHGNFSR